MNSNIEEKEGYLISRQVRNVRLKTIITPTIGAVHGGISRKIKPPAPPKILKRNRITPPCP